MRRSHILPLLALTLTLSGCYTTVVDTGREPSRRKFRDEWVTGFASGLIMTERVDAARRCPHGVARVKTEVSLPNFVVQTLTAGLLSPRTVEVTCAAGAEDVFHWVGDFEREIRIEVRREGRGRRERLEHRGRHDHSLHHFHEH